MRDAESRALRSTVVDLLSQPLDEPLDDATFNRAAMRVFRFQFARNVPYAAFCRRREATPDTVEHWTQVPAVPTAAFKEVALVAGNRADAEVVFRTSGTTQGAEKRGEHHVLDVTIYHFALLPNFSACMLPDGAELTMLSLVPSPSDMPDSSLAHMIAVVMERLGADDSAYFATATHGIDDARLGAALRAAERSGRPVCMLGTSFAFVHWLDRLAARGERFALPPGSRLMDTGGYKGRSREVAATDLRSNYDALLGIAASHCVNEYGMTEMCSQFYDSSLRDDARGLTRPRFKIVPPWVRTRAVDPETLAPLPHGSTGLLQHFDLANLGSVMAVQTEDVGTCHDDRFELAGRAAGAQPRGCSIAMDLLLEAVSPKQRL
jgi:hypothetical protein